MFNQLFGDPNARALRNFAPIVSDINCLEEDFVSLTDDELRNRVIDFRGKFEKTKGADSQLSLMDDLLPEVFAVVREASKRVLGMRHFDV